MCKKRSASSYLSGETSGSRTDLDWEVEGNEAAKHLDVMRELSLVFRLEGMPTIGSDCFKGGDVCKESIQVELIACILKSHGVM